MLEENQGEELFVREEENVVSASSYSRLLGVLTPTHLSVYGPNRNPVAIPVRNATDFDFYNERYAVLIRDNLLAVVDTEAKKVAKAFRVPDVQFLSVNTSGLGYIAVKYLKYEEVFSTRVEKKEWSGYIAVFDKHLKLRIKIPIRYWYQYRPEPIPALAMRWPVFWSGVFEYDGERIPEDLVVYWESIYNTNYSNVDLRIASPALGAYKAFTWMCDDDSLSPEDATFSVAPLHDKLFVATGAPYLRVFDWGDVLECIASDDFYCLEKIVKKVKVSKPIVEVKSCCRSLGVQYRDGTFKAKLAIGKEIVGTGTLEGVGEDCVWFSTLDESGKNVYFQKAGEEPKKVATLPVDSKMYWRKGVLFSDEFVATSI